MFWVVFWWLLVCPFGVRVFWVVSRVLLGECFWALLGSSGGWYMMVAEVLSGFFGVAREFWWML